MISIIVPVYNVEKYLDQCIDSIIKQTYTDWECILINDGSSDNSGIICDCWKERDSRIIVVHQPNYGVSTARNTGIDLAKGDYITFIDSDDWVSSNYLEVLIHHQTTYPSDIVVSGIIQTFQNGTSATFQPDSTISFDLNHDNITHFIHLNQNHLLYGPTSNLYQSKIIKYNKIYFDTRLSYGEDLVFNYKYLGFTKSITCVNQSHYYYRILGANSLSSIIRQDQFILNYNQWLVLKSFYTKRDLWSEESKEYLYHRLWGIIYDAIFLYPKIPNANIKYIYRILNIPEIRNLTKYKNSFKCSLWIKQGILYRQTLLFYLFFKLRH